MLALNSYVKNIPIHLPDKMQKLQRWKWSGIAIYSVNFKQSDNISSAKLYESYRLIRFVWFSSNGNLNKYFIESLFFAFILMDVFQ